MVRQLKLKVLWTKNFLGLSIDQFTAKPCLPLTVYYFWPRTEAWEQLKLDLELKPWIKEEERVKILNMATEVINFWRESRNIASFTSLKKEFEDITFVKTNI